MVTTVLDLVGGACLVACAYLVGGLAAGVGVAGALILLASWRASR